MARTAAKTSIHAVLGSDDMEVKSAATELAARLTPAAGGDFGAEIIDGAAENADDAARRVRDTIGALLTFPFFGGGKLVWLKNANFLADNVTGRSVAVIEALEELAEVLRTRLPAETKFLLSAGEVDKRRSFYKTLAKIAELQVFDKPDTGRSGWEEEVAQIVRTRAREHGLKFDEEALELFVLFTGGETRVIESELEKLDLFLGKARREVTVDDVRLVVPRSHTGVIFELGNAISRRNLRESFSLIDQLLGRGESAIGILLAAVAPTVRNLLAVKELMQRHRLSRPHTPFAFADALKRLPETAVEHLPKKKDGSVNAFALGIAAMNAHHYALDELLELHAGCLRANLQLVTSQLDPRVVLTELVAPIAEKK